MHPRKPWALKACAQAVALAFAAMASPAGALDFTWVGGTGNWSPAGANWNQAGLPSAADNVFIDNGNTGVNSVVNLNVVGNVNNLALDAGDTFNNTSGQFFSIFGPSFVNNGAYNLNGNGVLAFRNSSTLSGNGAIVLGNSGANNRITIEGSSTLTLDANAVIRGENGTIGGQVFVGGANVLANGGRVSADTSGGTINITAASTTNSGILEAKNGGTLQLSGPVTQTGSGQLNAAGVGSRVLQNGSAITGGVINTSGGGAFTAGSSASNYLNNVTVAGTVDMTTVANSRERIANGLTLNSGSFNIATGGILSVNGGTQTLGGTGGTINLNDAGARLALEGSGTTTLGSNIVVRGQGNIGQPALTGGSNNLVNNGRISADVSGGTLNIVPGAGSGNVTNNGILEATGGGTLLLSANVIGNTGSQISADAGSSVRQNGITITGVINTSGGGLFTASSNTANFLNGVTLNGTLDLASIANSRERIGNGLTLNGTVNVANGGILSLDSTLTTGGNQTLGGTGSINLNDAGARLALEGSGTTTLGSNIVVRGQGNIGQPALIGGSNNLVNNGRISADVSGGTLNIVPGAGSGNVTNNGILEATGGGTLLLSANVIGNTGSQISAGAGSSVRQNGITITGVINTSGGGLFTASSSTANFLNGVTLNGTLDLASIANSRERIGNGLTLNGTVNVANGGILSLDSTLTTGGNQTLGGTGSINLNDAGARLALEGSGTTTLGSNIVVRGQGNIGQAALTGGTNNLVNNGRISADVSGGTLDIVAGAGSGAVTNNNILEAKTGGTLKFSSVSINNGAIGQINAQNNGVVLHSAGSITGGTINTDGSGVFRAASSGTNVLDNVTVSGTVDMTTVAHSRERIVNGLTFSGGSFNIANGGILSVDGGTQTLGGTGGTINLNDASARLALEGSGTTTLGSNIVVRGQGNIGQPLLVGGTNNLMNQGTILGDGGTLTIVPGGGSGGFTNSGLVRANGGTVTIQPALTGNGTLQVDATGVVNLANVANTQGQLVMGAAGSTLNIGTQNLTIVSDYTNVAAGSGNSFNKRAGISGAGLVIAGGDAAQAITGTGVSNGNTANATLTLGNVRIGATTFDYQVANTGTTGPTLRGAIQTNVNGANLTDTRLSGAGVTASNYNTGGPGSNTGNLGVTFTAASAGLLAPLNGQVLNLRSNFDDIADQKLNIVLGTNAAAYNAAAGNATPSPAVLANQRVGGSASQVLTVTNNATASAFSEDLNAGFGTTSGAVVSGSISGRLAGTNNTGTGSMTVGVDTTTAGAKSHLVNIDYQTAGAVNGVSNGLGTASVGSQGILVQGNVYNLAQGGSSPTPVVLGNQRVGGTLSQQLTVANTAPASAFSEDLNASFGTNTGTASNNGGNVNGLLAGANNTAAMSVGVNTASAGAKSGTVTLNYQTAGAVNGVSNGLGTAGVGSQAINVSGNVYQLAAGQLNTAPLNFGTVQVGQSVSQVLSISNAASGPAGFVEDLNASFGVSNGTGAGLINGSGSVNFLTAGNTDASNMVVSVNTAAAGTINGGIAVNYFSAGTVNGASNGLGALGVGSANYGVQGTIQAVANVINQASPQINNGTINLGNVRVGAASQTANVSVTNVTTIAPQAALNASISGNAPITASGSFNLLAPGGTNASNLQVGMNTGSAGAINGTATLAFVSDASNVGNCAPNCQMNLASQDVTVIGAVYRLANPTLNTPSVTIAARVGDPVAANQAVSITNTSPDIYTEGLKVAVSGTSGNAQSNGGDIANLAAQGTNNSAIQVGLASTANAGTSNGQVTLDLTSTGAGTTGAADISVGSAIVNVVGKVYQQAAALVQNAVDFGIVHVGDVVAARNVQVQNTAPVATLNDTLTGSIGGAGGPFSTSGSLGSGVMAGQTDSSSLDVDLDTSTAGIFSGNAMVNLASRNPDMADLILADATVLLGAQVNNYANADLNKTSGNGGFSQSGRVFTLDFGNVILGASVSSGLEVLNDIAGPADLLDGLFNFLDTQDFLYAGFGVFTDLAAGQSQGLNVNFNALTLGGFSDDIRLATLGHNFSGYSGLLDDITLRIRANVVQDGGTVPEPGTLALLGIALAGLMVSRRRATLH